MDLDWSEQQRAAMCVIWTAYKERVASIRNIAAHHLCGLQPGSAAAVANWAAAQTMPQLQKSYTAVFDDASGLDAWPRLEMLAWADLCALSYPVSLRVGETSFELIWGGVVLLPGAASFMTCFAGHDPLPGLVHRCQLPPPRHRHRSDR